MFSQLNQNLNLTIFFYISLKTYSSFTLETRNVATSLENTVRRKVGKLVLLCMFSLLYSLVKNSIFKENTLTHINNLRLNFSLNLLIK
jgi:hypothetical protein